MTEPGDCNLPSMVFSRDGRLVPFDADAICQSIFAATEELCQPNAFLAREMTESVLHFLTEEYGAGNPTTAQIAELIIKVLRELGQGALAKVVEKKQSARANKQPGREFLATQRVKSPAEYLSECRRRYSLDNVFARDIVAAQEEGWLTLVGLEHPAELAGGVVDWPGREDRSLLAEILDARRRFGAFVALDSPEHAWPGQPIRARAREIRDGMAFTGLSAVLNLNVVEPPGWALAPSAGESPLFGAGVGAAHDSLRSVALLDAVLDELAGDGTVRIDWHLSESDFNPDSQLTAVLHRAVAGAPIGFVCDRPGEHAALGEGIDRRHPAVLQIVGLHLGPLVDIPGVEGNTDLLLEKLWHLARMALSAASQKRQFLRRQGERQHDLQRGFFLDRARLVVIPVGLAAVVQRLTGQSMATGKQGLALAKQIVQRLGRCLADAGKAANLEAILDSPWWSSRPGGIGPLLASPHLAGLTCADFQATVEDQVRTAGALHKLAGAGTAVVSPGPGNSLSAESLRGLLRIAWHKTNVVRLRIAASSIPV